MSAATKPTVTIEKPVPLPAITLGSSGKLKPNNPSPDVNKAANGKQNSLSAKRPTSQQSKYVDDGSKVLAGTYKPVNHSVKPSWYVDDGSRALAGTCKPVSHAVKPAWFKDDGSEALVKGDSSLKK